MAQQKERGGLKHKMIARRGQAFNRIGTKQRAYLAAQELAGTTPRVSLPRFSWDRPEPEEGR